MANFIYRARLTPIFIMLIACPVNAENTMTSGNWQISLATDELTNVSKTLAIIKSSNTVMNVLEQPEQVVMSASCSPGKAAIVSLRWPDIVSVEGQDKVTQVQWKFDNGDIESRAWRVLDDRVRLYVTNVQALALLSRAAQAQKFVIKVSGNLGPENAVFDVAGSSSVFEKLNSGCPESLLPVATSKGVTVSSKTAKAPGDALPVVRHVLETEGYEIAEYDVARGVITTLPSVATFSRKQLDCGSFFGLSYVGEPRTRYRAVITVSQSANGGITLSSQIEAIYLEKSLSCVSKGEYENYLLHKMTSAL